MIVDKDAGEVIIRRKVPSRKCPQTIHKNPCPICGRLKDKDSKHCKAIHKTPEEKRAKQREWAVNHRDRTAAAVLRWIENHPEEQKRIKRNNRMKYNEAYKARQRKFTNKRRAWLHEYKSSRGCSVCGEKDPRCLDFHHTDPATKSGLVSSLSARGWDRLRAEMEKCVVLCANCHRKHTVKSYANVG